MSREVVVRRAVERDVPALFRIRTAVRENHLSMEQLAERGITHESVAALIEDGEGVWVAEVSGEPAAFAMALSADRSIFAMFVSPGFEGRGLGRALMAEAERWLFSLSDEPIGLTTDTDPRIRAHGFYRRLGWVADGHAANGELRYVKTKQTIDGAS